ncbi:MAG TPA: PhnD/SsuA/transferrin family substrate-binding protein [Bauldia sp.]|nr:PhnD/SsuA/transferrin family substrate-binding protein [Bauldia sp.]
MAIACLPWYSLPEVEPAQDAVWSAIARHLRHAGVAAPERLIRNVPIPGVFCDPDLMLAQCCGYDVVYGFAGSLMVLATPVYAAPGCEGPTYRSFVLVRDDSPFQEIGDLRGGVCAVNSFNSHSGANALRALVAPLARDGRFFRAVKVTGAHVRSLELLMSGRADVMAMDCVLHALLARHRPAALHGTRVIAATEAAPAPPLVTSAVAGRDRAARVREAVLAAMDDPEAVSAKAELLIDRLEVLPIARYARIVEIEGEAVRRGFFELHATSPAIVEG